MRYYYTCPDGTWLQIVRDDARWRIQWIGTPAPLPLGWHQNPIDPDVRAADRAAAEYAKGRDVRGFLFSFLGACDALRAANRALRRLHEPPKWHAKALAAGWTPPRKEA